MGKYHVVFFDLDHTLIDTRGQYDRGLDIALRTTYPDGFPQDYPKHFMKHHARLWQKYDDRELSMEEVRRQRFILAWQDYGVQRTVEEADDFYRTYSATLDTTLVTYPGVHEMLRGLVGDYRLGIITNGSPDLQWRKMGITDLRQYFDEDSLIISERIGKAKPHPSVFQHACDVFSIAPHQALMIGDNYDKDILGARAFGMDTLWLVPDPVMADEARKMGVGDRLYDDPQQVPTAIRHFASSN